MDKDLTIELLNNQYTFVKINKKKNLTCKCKRIKCIKLYCECFRSNLQCNKDCLCFNCKNIKKKLSIEIQEEVKSVVINNKIENIKKNKIKIICKCNKSNCSNNYCPCFSKNMKCNLECNCKDCKNNINYFKNIMEKKSIKFENTNIQNLENKSTDNLKILLLEKLNFLMSLSLDIDDNN